MKTCPRCLSTDKAARVAVYPRSGEPEPVKDRETIQCPSDWHNQKEG